MTYKTCSRCGEEYEATTEFFVVEKRAKSGLGSQCRGCKKQGDHKYYQNNRERYKDPEFREKINQRAREYYQNNREECNKRSCEWQKQNNYHKNNKEKRNQRSRDWQKNNPDKINSCVARRKVLKLNQTPSNANMELIQFYYTVCSTMKDYHVDHIHPLSKGGLHHEDNLQLLEKSLNLEKSNKWPLTLEEEIKYKGLKL